jgi:hypothetical protein
METFMTTHNRNRTGALGPDKWLCILTWPSGREKIVLEDGMIMNRENVLRLNPHLEGRDLPELDQQVNITRKRKL